MRVDYEILSKLSMNKLLYIKIIWNAKNIIDQLELQHSSGRLTFVFFFFLSLTKRCTLSLTTIKTVSTRKDFMRK